MKNLQSYRSQIDEIDTQILELLSKRLEIVQEIAKVKREQNLPALDKKRWQEVLSSRINRGNDLGLSEDIVLHLFHLIHDEALKIENTILQ